MRYLPVRVCRCAGSTGVWVGSAFCVQFVPLRLGQFPPPAHVLGVVRWCVLGVACLCPILPPPSNFLNNGIFAQAWPCAQI